MKKSSGTTSCLKGYYPFGMVEPGRSYTLQSFDFGFNNKLNDNDVEGNFDWQDYGMREYLPRLGRFITTDPIFRKYPELSTYQFASNTPILAVDIDGLEAATEYNYTQYHTTLSVVNAEEIDRNRNLRIVNIPTAINSKYSDEEKSLLSKPDNKFPTVDFKSTAKFFEGKNLNETLDKIAFTPKHLSSKVADLTFQKVRYFSDPGNPLVIVDLRHFLAVGDLYGITGGKLIETGQELANLPSGGNVQDYYSNQLGTDFFTKFYKPNSKQSFSEQFQKFFEKRKQEYLKSQSKENSESK